MTKALSYMTHRHLAAAMSAWRQSVADSQRNTDLLATAAAYLMHGSLKRAMGAWKGGVKVSVVKAHGKAQAWLHYMQHSLHKSLSAWSAEVMSNKQKMQMMHRALGFFRCGSFSCQDQLLMRHT